MKLLASFVLGLFVVFPVYANDPGVRDSVIIETVNAAIGDSIAEVRAYVTCDDTVGYYNLPLTWSSPDSMITFIDVTYHDVLLEWDETFDSLLQDLDFLRMFGYSDISGPDNPPLITNNTRVLCWTFRFAIDPAASPQIVVIDTTFDPVIGSMRVMLWGGVPEFAPVFTPGMICYAMTADNSGQAGTVPSEFGQLHNYPNPFNTSTTVEFTLPEAADIDLAVYNIPGQKIAVLFDGRKTAGRHSVTWNAGDMPSGVYFGRLESGGDTRTSKIILLK